MAWYGGRGVGGSYAWLVSQADGPLRGTHAACSPTALPCTPLISPSFHVTPATTTRPSTVPHLLLSLISSVVISFAPYHTSYYHKFFINAEMCCNPDPVVFNESSLVGHCCPCLFLPAAAQPNTPQTFVSAFECLKSPAWWATRLSNPHMPHSTTLPSSIIG